MIKTYQLNLPVFKAGDDMAECLKETQGNASKALALASLRYQVAAAQCLELSVTFGDHCQISMDADTHLITITGPEEILNPLVDDELLVLACPPSRDEDEEEKEFGKCAGCGDETPPGNLYCRNCEEEEEELNECVSCGDMTYPGEEFCTKCEEPDEEEEEENECVECGDPIDSREDYCYCCEPDEDEYDDEDEDEL